MFNRALFAQLSQGAVIHDRAVQEYVDSGAPYQAISAVLRDPQPRVRPNLVHYETAGEYRSSLHRIADSLQHFAGFRQNDDEFLTDIEGKSIWFLLSPDSINDEERNSILQPLIPYITPIITAATPAQYIQAANTLVPKLMTDTRLNVAQKTIALEYIIIPRNLNNGVLAALNWQKAIFKALREECAQLFQTVRDRKALN